MNRQIKFRGKTISYKEKDYEYKSEWVYGYYHKDHNGQCFIIDDYPGGRVYPGD